MGRWWRTAVVWEGSRVGKGAVVRGSIVAGATLKAGTRIERAIVMPGRPARVWPLEAPVR